MDTVNYDGLIAEAARRYCLAKRDCEVWGTDQLDCDRDRAYARLYWLVDAKKFGWDPKDLPGGPLKC